MKIAEAVSIAHAQRDALERKADEVLEKLEADQVGGPVLVGDCRELAELAVSAAHHWKLEENHRRGAGDVVGTVIGYALLSVVLLVIGAGSVWVVRAAWSWALS